ncbi:MAG: DUF4131 domain-containing protein [Acidobacteria bacterium]|nr:DUF4131 domain-containing protein [Acidobacteriota bacterium]
MRDPLAIPALALAAGVASARWLDLEIVPALVAGGLLLLVAVFAVWRGFRIAAITAVGGIAWCAGIAAERYHRPGPDPVIEFEPGELMLLEGCVAEPPSLSLGREQFVLELVSNARVRVTFYLNEGDTPPDLHYGQKIEMEARLRKPHNYQNPGAFDFVGFLARKHIYWTASANARTQVRILGNCGNRYLAILYRIREFALGRLDQFYAGDAYANGMSRAVLLGDSARLERVWTEQFRRTGTYHALVISGLHLTTLAACFLFLFRVCGLRLVWSLGGTCMLAWGYAIMAGASAPVVRAAVGLSLYQVGVWFYRRPRVLNLLALTAILFLLADPHQLFDVSFQLTFLAVGMIAGVAAPWMDEKVNPARRGVRSLNLRAWDRHLPAAVASMRVELRLLADTVRWVARVPPKWTLLAFSGAGRVVFFAVNLLVISAVVQIGLTLPMIAYFHRVPVSGLSANLLIVPLMNAVVPLGFVAVATGWTWLADLAAILLHASRTVAEWHAEREPNWRIGDPPDWLVGLFLATLVLAAGGLLRGRRWTAAPFAAVWIVLVWHPFPERYRAGWLELTAVDVGQGDCLMLVTPDGKRMLIDTGGFPKFRNQKRAASFDVGEEVVSPYLFTRSLRRVDVIALSHAHEDHTGGLKSLVANFRPGEIWTGAFPADSVVHRLGIVVRSLHAGQEFGWGGARIRVLSPPAGYEAGAEPKNNDSLTMRVDYGQRSFLLTGDIERAMEFRMLEDGLVSRVDVLKVAHHGSRTSTTEQFLEAARPVHAIISDGPDNVFRHPHPDVVRRLEDRGVRVWRTDRDGLITVRTDGWKIEVSAHGAGR